MSDHLITDNRALLNFFFDILINNKCSPYTHRQEGRILGNVLEVLSLKSVPSKPVTHLRVWKQEDLQDIEKYTDQGSQIVILDVQRTKYQF